MKRFGSSAAAMIFALVASGYSMPALSESLKVGGTGGATELMRELASRYGAKTGVKLEVIPSLGSSGGARALVDGVLDFAMTGRPLKAKETAKGLVERLVLKTPFVFASSHPKPNGLTVAELAESYRSNAPRWKDGTPLRVILRPQSDSDTALVAKLLPEVGRAVAEARKRKDLPVAANDQDNATAAEKAKGSLIGAGYAQILLEKRDLRFVAVGRAMPSLEAMESGAYKFVKPLYLVTPKQMGVPLAKFVDWLKSEDGTIVLRSLHVVGG